MSAKDISGAITYAILKKNKKKVVIFFDNHVDQTYCNGSLPYYVSHFCDEIRSSLIYEQPLDRDSMPANLQFSPDNAPHTLSSPSRSRIIPVDIRWGTLYNRSTRNIGDLLDTINKWISDDCQEHTSPMIRTHGMHLKTFLKKCYDNLDLQSTQLGKNLLIPLINIHGDFPFSASSASNPSELLEEIMSGSMELYSIMKLKESQSVINTMYMGAAHAFRVYCLLKNRYGWSVSHKPFEGDVENMNLYDIDNLQNCVTVNMDHYSGQDVIPCDD